MAAAEEEVCCAMHVAVLQHQKMLAWLPCETRWMTRSDVRTLLTRTLRLLKTIFRHSSTKQREFLRSWRCVHCLIHPAPI